MWYRTAIDFGSFFGKKEQNQVPEQPVEKLEVPNDIFREQVRTHIPSPQEKIDLSKGSQHLILTGSGDIHQGDSHSSYLESIFDKARKSLREIPDIANQYDLRKLPDAAYGPEDLVERRNFQSGPGEPILYQEDAVTEILHDYFDRGIRISNMEGFMTVNAIHIPTSLQIQKIYEIIHLIQPKSISFKIKTDKGKFVKVYDIDNAVDFKKDLLDFTTHGEKKPSTMRDWRNF
jgi:hypothetical protein